MPTQQFKTNSAKITNPTCLPYGSNEHFVNKSGQVMNNLDGKFTAKEKKGGFLSQNPPFFVLMDKNLTLLSEFPPTSAVVKKK